MALIPFPGWAVISLSASLTASGWGQEVTNTGTITGPAPLAVFFDATGTTSVGYEAFREAGYHFDFGYATPTTPGTWTYSGKPKGNQIGGPVAAHVYETPGTYTASVRAQLPSGTYQDKFITVVVEDPDTYWTTGGRTTTTLVRSSITAWPTWASNTRYLLEAGQDYSTLASAIVNIINIQNVYLAKTGSGADPIVATLRFNYTTGTTPTTGAKVIFSQLNSKDELSAPVGGSDCLFYKCSGQNPTTGTLLTARYSGNPSVTWDRPRRIFYWECPFDGLNLDLPFFTQTYQLAILGCSSTRPREHGCRVQGAQYAFIGSNWFHDYGGGGGPKHGLTIRATGIGELSAVADSTETLYPATRYVVAADNLIGDGAETGTTWPVQLSPFSSAVVEGSEYVIVERTIYNNIPAWTGYPVVESTRGCRNNTIRDSNYTNFSPAITTGTSFSENYGANPPEWSEGPIYSNTFISPKPDNVYTFYTPTGLLPAKAGT